MRIYGPNGMGAAATAPAARRNGGTFSLGEAEAQHLTPQNAAPRALGGIDALIALQGVEDATQRRRRRAVSRARGALDALEALKLGLLSARLDGGAVARLTTALADLAEPSGDPRLDAILAEIGLRVGVELAKIGMPNSD